MIFKNYTPHQVTLYDDDNQVIMSLQPEPEPIRLLEHIKQQDPIDGIPVVKKAYYLLDLPDKRLGTILIVSYMVAEKGRRDDLYVPDTGPDSVVRDSAGNILGVKRLQRII
jgi:hypothetical protein